MEGQIHNEPGKPITLNLDEFDIDSYDFKPITKGLGFNEAKEKKSSFPKQKKPLVNTAKSEPRVMSSTVTHQMPKKDYLQNTPLSVSDPSLMSGIEALYNDGIKKKNEKTKPKPIEKKKVKLKEADTIEQIYAFAFDFIVVAAMTLLFIASFYFLAFGNVNIAQFKLFCMDSIPYIFTLFGIIFVTYFTMTEPVSTIGKKMMKISTFQTKGEKRITIRQSFVRSVTTLFSLFLIGLPLVLDFQGKLSDSRVVRK